MDLRRQLDHNHDSMSPSINIPLKSLHADSASPFYAPEVLDQQWRELEGLFSQSFLQSQFVGKRLLCLCYDGDTARVATSVLRSKGFDAESIKGGFRALRSMRAKSPADSVMEEKAEVTSTGEQLSSA